MIQGFGGVLVAVSSSNRVMIFTGHLEHIIKAHKQKRMQHNVDIIQIVKLAV